MVGLAINIVSFLIIASAVLVGGSIILWIIVLIIGGLSNEVSNNIKGWKIMRKEQPKASALLIAAFILLLLTIFSKDSPIAGVFGFLAFLLLVLALVFGYQETHK